MKRLRKSIELLNKKFIVVRMWYPIWITVQTLSLSTARIRNACPELGEGEKMPLSAIRIIPDVQLQLRTRCGIDSRLGFTNLRKSVVKKLHEEKIV